MNNFKRKLFTVILLLLSIIPVFAQKVNEANRLFQQGAELLQNGRYEESIPYFQKAEKIYENQTLNNDNSAYTALWRGLAYYSMFDYESAIADFDIALNKAETKNDREIRLSASLHLANSYYAMDKWEEAYILFLSSLELSNEFQARAYFPSVYEGLGKIDFSWGKYDSALHYYQEALKFSEELGYRENTIHEKITIGRLYFAQNKFDESISYLNRILEEDGIKKSQYYSTLLNSLGMAHMRKMDLNESLMYFMDALNLTDVTRNILEEIQLLIHIGGVLHLQERYDDALLYYEMALPLALTNQRKEDASTCLFNLGMTSVYLEDYESAVDYFLQTVDLKEELRLSVVGESRKDYFAAELQVYQWLSTVYLHLNEAEKATEILEQASSKYLREQLQQDQEQLVFNGVINFQQNIDENQSVLKIGSINTIWQSLINISSSEINGMYFFHEQLLDKLPQSYANDFIKLNESSRGLSAIRQEETISTIEGKTVEDLIQYYRLLLSGKSNLQEIKRIGRLLYDYFLGPVEDKIEDKNHLIIVPEGLLAFIPFETFIMPDGRYLVEKYNISYAQSLAVMEIIGDRYYSTDRDDFLGIGGAEYEQIDEKRIGSPYNDIIVEKWLNLPGTLEEINNIRDLFDKSLLLSGNNASEVAIKSLSIENKLENYKIIHFATHGFVLPDFPELSALVLSQNNLTGDDGYLDISEISRLNIQADFVNLSACETGLGKIYGGEGVVGLAQAFLIAGANSLSVSLWQVSDESTRDFMTGFYELNQKNSFSYNEAMAEMKRSFIISENYNHPYYWAPFVFYGN